jgi:hypothetical protein
MGRGDTKRSHSVKADFDGEFSALSLGGAVLVEKALRSLGVRRLLGHHLSEGQAARAYGLLVGLLVGGRGQKAAEWLGEDPQMLRLFGLESAACSDSSSYRLLCDLAGLAQRKQSEAYVAAGEQLPRLDMLGQEQSAPQLRRVVPESPEAASEPSLEMLDGLLGGSAKRCLKALPRSIVRVGPWHAVFGDATDLQVEGRCFDAARMGRDGQPVLRWQTLTLGPVLVAQRLHPGNRDEGRSMPELLKRGREVIAACLRPKALVLALLDAAYCEKPVIETLQGFGWHYIVCANQWRNVLSRLAGEQPQIIWRDSGADARRGWIESQTGVFIHQFAGWSAPVTIVARRWRESGDLPGVWRHSFLITNIDKGRVPPEMMKHGYAQAIWMLYGTKQGRENHYKTPLRDLGLHHPPSGRLGVNQAFYALASVASNVAMVLRYRVLPAEERGMELWNLRQKYFQIAGRLARTGRTLMVWLAGASLHAARQTLWRQAFAEAGRL